MTRISSLICKHERVVINDEEFGLFVDWIVIDVDTVDEWEIGRMGRKWRGGGSGGTIAWEWITELKSVWEVVKGIDA